MTEPEWRLIDDFPGYAVSNDGRIFNSRTEQEMALSRTTHGHVKVALVNGYVRRTVSVAVLVASAFVEPPSEGCDQVVLLNGLQDDLRASNMVWRPKWFNWKYVRQLKNPLPRHFCNLAVANEVTQVRYNSIYDAGTSEGLLFDDIWRSTYAHVRVYPTRDTFTVIGESIHPHVVQRL